MTTLDAIRKGIRRGRQDREMTVDALEVASGVNRATIHMLERVNKYPDLNPKIDTILKIVEDGLGLTFCAFVCWVEGVEPNPVGLPAMPEDLRLAALHQPRQTPTEPSPESTRATKAAKRSKAVLSRHR